MFLEEEYAQENLDFLDALDVYVFVFVKVICPATVSHVTGMDLDLRMFGMWDVWVRPNSTTQCERFIALLSSSRLIVSHTVRLCFR